MKIEFTGRQTGIPDELRRLAERKLQKVGRLLPAVTRAHVILAVDKHRQVAEVSVHSRHMDLAAIEVERQSAPLGDGRHRQARPTGPAAAGPAASEEGRRHAAPGAAPGAGAGERCVGAARRSGRGGPR